MKKRASICYSKFITKELINGGPKVAVKNNQLKNKMLMYLIQKMLLTWNIFTKDSVSIKMHA